VSVLLATVAALLHSAAAEPATIAALLNDPKSFHGRVVSLSGWVNDCRPLSCALEDRPGSGQQQRRRRLSIAADREFDEAVATGSPVRVQVDARFDATCLTTHICVDRVPVLTIIGFRVAGEGSAIRRKQ